MCPSFCISWPSEIEEDISHQSQSLQIVDRSSSNSVTAVAHFQRPQLPHFALFQWSSCSTKASHQNVCAISCDWFITIDTYSVKSNDLTIRACDVAYFLVYLTQQCVEWNLKPHTLKYTISCKTQTWQFNEQGTASARDRSLTAAQAPCLTSCINWLRCTGN